MFLSKPKLTQIQQALNVYGIKVEVTGELNDATAQGYIDWASRNLSPEYHFMPRNDNQVSALLLNLLGDQDEAQAAEAAAKAQREADEAAAAAQAQREAEERERAELEAKAKREAEEAAEAKRVADELSAQAAAAQAAAQQEQAQADAAVAAVDSKKKPK